MTTIYCEGPIMTELNFCDREAFKNVKFVMLQHFDDVIEEIKHRKKVIRFEDLKGHHPVFDPPENSVFIFDRRMIERDFINLMYFYGISFRDKLYDLWKKRNVKVLFNFAFYEALMYEQELYDFITFDFPFKHLKLTDYPLFENKPNFLCDRMYNLFFYFNESLEGNFLKVPRKKHTLDKKYLFSTMQMKLRPHRLDFIKKLASKDLHKHGYITGTREYFEEYKDNLLAGYVTTDNNGLQNEYYYKDTHRDFFEKEWEDHNDIFVDGIGEDIHRNHTMLLNRTLDYNLSYIDICGETHAMYNTMYPIYTEKSLTPIFFDKMFLFYGSNCFYEVLNKVGGHNFKDELLLPENYFTTKDPYDQIDMIINSLEQLSKVEFGEVFQESQDKIKENKVLLLEYFKKIMKPVVEFING